MAETRPVESVFLIRTEYQLSFLLDRYIWRQIMPPSGVKDAKQFCSYMTHRKITEKLSKDVDYDRSENDHCANFEFFCEIKCEVCTMIKKISFFWSSFSAYKPMKVVTLSIFSMINYCSLNTLPTGRVSAFY